MRGYVNHVACDAGLPSPPEQALGERLALLRNACHVGSKTGLAPAIQFIGLDEVSLPHAGIRWNLQETAACLDGYGFVLCAYLPSATAIPAERARRRAEYLRDLRRHGVRIMLDCHWQPGGRPPAEVSEDACDFVRFDFSAPCPPRMRPCPDGLPALDEGTPAWLRSLASRHLVDLVASGIGTPEQLCRLKDLSFDLYQGPQLLPGIEIWRAPGED